MSTVTWLSISHLRELLDPCSHKSLLRWFEPAPEPFVASPGTGNIQGMGKCPHSFALKTLLEKMAFRIGHLRILIYLPVYFV